MWKKNFTTFLFITTKKSSDEKRIQRPKVGNVKKYPYLPDLDNLRSNLIYLQIFNQNLLYLDKIYFVRKQIIIDTF